MLLLTKEPPWATTLCCERSLPSTAVESLQTPKILNFDYIADPDPVSQNNAEPDPVSQNNADPDPRP
jgi:hypothetical protein